MKKLFAIVALITVFLLGSTIGHGACSYLFEDYSLMSKSLITNVSGLAFVLVGLISLAPTGALRSSIASDMLTQLGPYVQLNKKAIWGKIRQGVELYQFQTRIAGVTGSYTGRTLDVTELHQPFQKGIQSKGTPSITPFVSTNYHMKVDMLLDNVDELYNEWSEDFTDENSPRNKWPFVKYFVELAFIPKMIEEINDMYCRASFVAPTAGTAGAAMTAMTGYFTLVTDLITSGDLTPIVVGAMNNTNGVDKVLTFMDAIPEKFKANGGTIFTSTGKRKNYTRNYSTINNASGLKEDRSMVYLDDENKIKIIGLTGAGAANRMIYIPGDPKAKLLQLYNKKNGPDGFDVQLQGRDLLFLHDRWDGVGFNNLDGIFVSDVA